MKPRNPYFLVLITILLLATLPAAAQEEIPAAHLTLENPAKLSGDEANAIYSELQERMAQGYAVSNLAIIRNYQNWQKFSANPYISATHGQRYISNYANRRGANYGALKEGEAYRVGTVLAKDSITVTGTNKSFPGALFVMEKLPKGTSPATADWRYILVNPDGSLFGDTTGEEPENVTYCHDCHEQEAENDYVFFIPEEHLLKQ